MPDFQYQPPTGPLSGSEFERQTTRFFQQVQGAADTAQSTAIVAQTTANEALERAQASNFVDGKTTTEAGGVITVKDVAIGGNLEDLASARGQIGNAVIVGTVDFNTLVKQGVYSPAANSTNGPNWSGQQVIVVYQRNVANQGRRVVQYAFNATTNAAAMRIGLFTTGTEETPTSWSNWTKIISENSIGDGIRDTNGIISVPEYEGATASAAGTSGLVPPATAGQQESFLTGGGEYKPALTKISDSVSLEDSKTAASAKAVKTAYDRGTAGVTAANGKLSLSGGVMSGRIGGLRGNYNADASSRYVTGALEIRENGGVGNAQSDIAYAPTIGFHWANRVAGLLALRSDGIFSFMKQNGTRAVVDCDVPYATAANKLRREGGVDTVWNWAGQGGQPGWLWGGNDGVNMYVYNPANFSVNYANSCNYANSAGSAPANGGTAWAVTVTPNVVNVSYSALPAGGTWLVMSLDNGDGGQFQKLNFSKVAGGTRTSGLAIRIA